MKKIKETTVREGKSDLCGFGWRKGQMRERWNEGSRQQVLRESNDGEDGVGSSRLFWRGKRGKELKEKVDVRSSRGSVGVLRGLGSRKD